ncbi:MAG: ABC transporter ATP-binding protein [Actinobacteria bacterium]|nr:MAG: ABC transporter ATP-binding protein [Actinomycetota bacterium]
MSSDRPGASAESGLAIECIGLTKSYRIGQELSLQRSMSRLLRPWRSQPLERFGALDDLSFTVPRGAFFGIVGPNGSGKSTLTQVLSGITVPSGGEARVWGQILPLLEVGAGFHDELTGRENIYLLGAILGLPIGMINASVARIVEFAGVHRHLDTAMKRYSSGMKARLSFSTAICFPADIYVFDEVLAVVDDDFRGQCHQALDELNAQGRTILFMSHDLDLVVEMCSTGMWIEHGHQRHVGPIQEVAAAYRGNSDHVLEGVAS